MDLPTHAFFGLAVGLIIFGHPEFALLVALGAIIPDLDREYWFVKVSVYRDEQLHRALLHNVFVMIAFYLVSPFLTLGTFLHMVLDSFTTSKDRGCEWFWPLSRLVKRGMYDHNKVKQQLDPKERVCFYQEDTEAVIEFAEPDLPEPPSPWRRVYGPALNSSLLDRGFLFGSIGLLMVWVANQYFSNANIWGSTVNYIPLLVASVSISLLFAGGELDRRDQEAPFGVTQLDQLKKISYLKYPLVVLGILLTILWLVLFRASILANLEVISSHWIPITASVAVLTVMSIALVRWYTKKIPPPAVV